MATKAEAKRYLIGALAQVLMKDDDFFPDEVDQGDEKAVRPWRKASDELVEEFWRRAALSTPRAPR